MRKLIFLFVTLLTGYMAGVFRSVPLMVLAVLEAALFVFSFFQARYLQHGMCAEFVRHGETLEKSAWLVCPVKIKNGRKLPVSRFQIRLRYGYGQEKEESGGAGRKTKFRTKYIEGSCDCGESMVQFEVCAHYCGLMTVRMNGLRVYDYLSLFSAFGRQEEQMEVAVYPGERALHLERMIFGEGEEGRVPEQASARGGETGSQVRQLREYETGDSSRCIHWNLSARMGELWVKEYEKEADHCIRLFLETEGLAEIGEAKADAFYELLSALVLGLLQHGASVRVYWQDAVGSGRREMEITRGSQRQELLLALYRGNLPQTEQAGTGERFRGREEGKGSRDLEGGNIGRRTHGSDKGKKSRYSEQGAGGRRFRGREEGAAGADLDIDKGNYLRLDIQLRLYREETLLYVFSAEALESQIEEGKFVL